MKRHVKLISICLVCLGLCTSLVGCDKTIDEIRETSVMELDNGNLLYGGNEYRLLPDGEYGIDIRQRSEPLSLIPKGIPLLLGEMYSNNYVYSYNNGEFISEQYYYGHIDGDYSTYCRVDLYDRLAPQIKAGVKYTTYSYDYLVMKPYSNQTYTLTQEQVDAIELVLAQTEPKAMYWEDVDYDYIKRITKYSEDGAFSKTVIIIAKNGDSYHLEDIVDNDIEMVYPVPESMNPIFDEIMELAIEYYT